SELEAENERLRRMLAFKQAERRLTLEPAHVLANSLDGTLLIDRGSTHGISEGMGVINYDGVIGIVAKVEPFQATVFTLNHPRCQVSAVIKRNRVASLT